MPSVSSAKPKVQKRDRLMGAIFSGSKTMLVSFGRTFYALWLQITGLFFVMFTVIAASALVRQYRTDHFADHRRLSATLAFAVVCAWFGVLSFVKAKRMRKS
ncbi:MAG TPA: hypothetical protein VJN64_13735 [Terriglobales bacterium]|nr:hypothetical protein [Terriglobales bacterium]